MATYKNISSKVIIRKVMRDLKPNNDNWIDDAVEWMGEALEHIGAASQLCIKKSVLDVVDHKALLPSDLYYINQVAINGTISPKISNELLTLTDKVKSLKTTIKEYNETLESEIVKSVDGTYTSNITTADLETYDTQYKSNVLELNEINSRIIVLEGMFFNVDGKGGSTLTPLSYGASTFPDAIHCDKCVNEVAAGKDSYIIDCDYIKTSFPTGTVCLSYMAFPLDEDCFPMVPDSISYKEAMFWYIFKQMLLGGWDKPTNKIDYNFADQKWKYYCTQARNEATYPDIDKMENFMNQWIRLVPELNNHELFFEELNTREDLNRTR
mgnify:FL=1|jgi:hypothetical protein|tara:strand:- start:34709 stop:35683 length:975 start_codon:yes stop_codon:yes gene_type:complete